MIKKQKMVKKSYWIPEDLADRLREYSNKTGESDSFVVRASIAKWLWEHPLTLEDNTNRGG